jgi:hypothetical protein
LIYNGGSIEYINQQLVWVLGMAVLKINKANESQEIDFELNYLASLTVRDRFQMMLQKNREMMSLLKPHGSQTTTEVIKRS